jgi:hypothetical protein
MDNAIESLTLEVADSAASQTFYQAAFDVGAQIRARAAAVPSNGFRGFTISLVVGQPSTVDSLLETALKAGAKPVKPAEKGMWGYGAIVNDADGVIWKLATSSKKEKGAATRKIDDLVLLIGAADMGASKRFYVEHGLTVKRSFLGRYVEFDAPPGGIKLALYPGRAGLAKDAGVSPDGDGPHGLAVNSAAGPFVDPDGFVWETA